MISKNGSDTKQIGIKMQILAWLVFLLIIGVYLQEKIESQQLKGANPMADRIKMLFTVDFNAESKPTHVWLDNEQEDVGARQHSKGKAHGHGEKRVQGPRSRWVRGGGQQCSKGYPQLPVHIVWRRGGHGE